MLTKNDKKYISETIKENNGVLIKEMIELFNATNERIDKVEEKLDDKIDKVEERLSERIDLVENKLSRRIGDVLDKLKDHDIILTNHGGRLGKIEEKVFAT
jgi:tetrahydromethanopterin S-methyltransferase subunit G